MDIRSNKSRLAQVVSRGISEAEDYSSVVLHHTSQSADVTHVLLCGYSAGSLSAAACPPLPVPCRTRYLLISYPLGVLWALTLFRSGHFTDALRQRIRQSSVLSIRGTADQFTSDARYKAWERNLGSLADSAGGVSCEVVEGADHFWGDSGKKRQVLMFVDKWLMGV